MGQGRVVLEQFHSCLYYSCITEEEGRCGRVVSRPAPREVRPLMDGELRKFAAGKRCRNFNAFWWRVEADWLKLQNRIGLQLIVSLPRVNTGFVVGLLTHSLHRT